MSSESGGWILIRDVDLRRGARTMVGKVAKESRGESRIVVRAGGPRTGVYRGPDPGLH
ncbi:beta-glucosidase [Amycolatopsis marina]|uniref:Beta-glucosidase n=1 Tax=Amycolatopsis marina TaxID=490629 RepID=A0A1I1CPT8_9PSEU|nr:beta-glucosidase [Amycolatopsis marina]